jgi:SAM-dependent methyltransferase
MKNKKDWHPTKFIETELGYSPNTNTKYVNRGSFLMVHILIKVYIPIIRAHAQGLLLDLGCGYVPLFDIYKPYIVDNICIDWENSLHKNPYLDYEFNLNDPIPIESNKFDTILCTDVLEHIFNPVLLMSEITRLLKPKGKLILTIPFFYWLHEEPNDFFRYTKHSLENYCEMNRLNVISLEPYGGAWEIVMDIISKNIAKHRILSKIHLKLCKLLLKGILGKNIASYRSQKFPLGYYLIAQKPGSFS